MELVYNRREGPDTQQPFLGCCSLFHCIADVIVKELSSFSRARHIIQSVWYLKILRHLHNSDTLRYGVLQGF